MLKQFVESNYKDAVETQRSFDHDAHMQSMLVAENLNEKSVRDWMRGYGLFQGINAADRRKVVEIYKDNIFAISNLASPLPDHDVRELFSVLLNAFYEVVPRKWISAVSKLLWCSFPHEIAIYDAFVHRSLIVLQGVTPYLAEMPRLGNTPPVKKGKDIQELVEFYMSYRKMILAIQKHHQDQLDDLRKKYSEQYAYDIRILDKLLWLLGGADQPFKLGAAKCT